MLDSLTISLGIVVTLLVLTFRLSNFYEEKNLISVGP